MEHLVLFVALALVYFAPTLIARKREHNNLLPIFLVNLLGMAVIPWLVALLWACTDNTATHRAEELEKLRRALR
jgi:hypothetical protein